MATLVYVLDFCMVLLVVCSWTSSMGIIYQFSLAEYALIMLQFEFSLLFAIEPSICNSNLLTICYLFQRKTIDSAFAWGEKLDSLVEKSSNMSFLYYFL